MDINLLEGINDPEKAKEIVGTLQKEIDGLVIASKEAIKVGREANKISTEYKAQVDKLSESNLYLTQALKNIHIVLNAEKDIWKDNASIVELVKALDTFIVSSGAVKAGVLSNESNEG